MGSVSPAGYLKTASFGERHPLVVALGRLRAAHTIHHNNHWSSAGATSYGDHLLFQRLYEETFPWVDSVGERIIGLQIPLNFADLMSLESELVQELYSNSRNDLIQLSLNAVLGVQMALTGVREAEPTDGTENLIDDISDGLETHVYLLQQRITGYYRYSL